MPIITTLLILIGVAPASFGVLMFLALAYDPDPDSIRFARRCATAGRWITTPAIMLCLTHGGSHGTPMITLLVVAAATAVATIVTKANLTNRPNGAVA
jgi:hypothetical protein